LSPRTIFYGGRNIKWECAETSCDELLGTFVPPWTQSDKLRGKARLARQIPTAAKTVIDNALYQVPEYLLAWFELIEDYRSRMLSVSSHRTMAIAGVAEAFQHEHDLTYFAGAWVQFLPYCLLWSISGQHSFDGHPPREPAAMAAPSWSWFAQPICHTICLRFEYHYNHYENGSIQTFMARLLNFQWPSLAPDEVPPTSFHDFAGLRITLALATFTTSLQRSQNPREAGGPD
jgi:hypothetical protein